MGVRPRMLSSQPKRSWGDSSDDENERPEFTLNSEDWPPTPPKPRPATTRTATGSTAAAAKGKAAAASAGRATSGATGGVNVSSGFSRPAAAATGATSSRASAPPKPPVVTDAAKPRLAPLFRRSSTPSSSSSARPPVASTSRVPAGPSTFPYNNPSASSLTGASLLPKKRTLPWEELELGPTKSSRSGSANFHELSAPGGANGNRIATGMKGKMLTSDSMDIKQKVVLSPEQQMVLKLVVADGKNVFFTGSAGTGKSVLLREIIASLRRKYQGNVDAVAVTASTGMAACNIGGTTIHSFGAIGLGNQTAEELLVYIKRNRASVAKWQRAKVLIIDEVSMVDGHLFDKIAKIAQVLRTKKGSKTPPRPFGGLQLVVTGDFFQLPPVSKGEPTFAFQAEAWKTCIDHTVNLTQVFRQKDTEFIDMLNEMRFGKLSPESIRKFHGLARERRYTDGIEPTELFAMRHEVENANNNRLRALPGEMTVFKAEDGEANPRPGQKSTYLSNFMAPELLQLKKGAQVMLIKNLDTTLVNGSVGTVVGFGVPELQDDDDDDLEEWTVGADGERIKIKPELSAQDARRKQKIVEAIAAGKLEMGPIVEWQTPLGVHRKVMVREEFKVEDNKGYRLAWRKQYPIILAWAMSIHKSQGQTIARVKVDLRRVFEKGQSYVALSRATSLEGLQVLGFNPDKVRAHEKVIEWSRSLQVLA